MNRIEFPNRLIVMMKNKNLYAAGILILLLVIFYRDVVFYGRTFLMETGALGTMPNAGPYQYKGITPGFVANDAGAIAWQIEPFNRFASKSVKKGDFPLWNPYAGLAGSPLLADGQTSPIEPLQFFFFFIPSRYWPYAVDTQLLLRFFIAGFSCYLFAKRQKIDFLGSISAGVLFMFSSYFVTFGNHAQIKTEALLPLVLYGYDRLADPEDRPGFWICALFVGWVVVAAMPESTFFVLFLGTLWYFYKSVFNRMEKGKVFLRTKYSLLRYLGPTVLGLLISSAYLLPFLEYVSLARSVHSPGTGGTPFPIWALPNVILFQTQSRHLILGFFAMFSLVFSLLHIRDWPEYRRAIIFFSLYATIFTLTIFDFPLTNWIRVLPVFNQLVFTKYPLPSIVFCLAILVGILVDRARYSSLSDTKILWSFLIVFAIFFGLPIFKNHSTELFVFFTNNKLTQVTFEFIIGIFMAFIFLVYLYRRQKISSLVLQIGILILVVSEPFVWSTEINRPDRIDPYQVPPFVDYLRDDKEPFRIFGLDGLLYPNVSTAYGLADIRWLNALVPRRAFDFSTKYIQPIEPWTMRLTGTALPISDGMFDLLNVKYVLLSANSSMDGLDICSLNADTQPYFGRDTIDGLILEQNPDKKSQLLEAPLNINGATRMTILAQAPQEFSVKLNIPQSPSTLDFSIGLSPDVFLPEFGDGVTFKVALIDGSNNLELYSRYIDPKNNPCDRKWFDESLNLAQWSGKEVILNFSTDPGPAGSISWDWAFWGSISLSAKTNPDQPKQDNPFYKEVYRDRDVLIYQNEDVLPRAFVVYSIVNVSSTNDAFAQLASRNIELKQTAVVENLPVELANSINKNDKHMQLDAGSTKLISSGELEVEIDTKAPGLLIVTDQYYPGWKAYIDGKQEPIYAVDGIFRGVFLEEGDHIIQFKYQPLSFMIGAIISSLSLLVTIMFLLTKFKVLSKKYE